MFVKIAVCYILAMIAYVQNEVEIIVVQYYYFRRYEIVIIMPRMSTALLVISAAPDKRKGNISVVLRSAHQFSRESQQTYRETTIYQCVLQQKFELHFALSIAALED